MPAARQAPDRGFTLLELLVGLVILGFVLAGLGQGTSFGLRASDSQSRLAARSSGLDAVDRALRHLVEAADPGTDRTPASLAGTRGTLTLTAQLPQAAAAYRLADIALGTDDARNLVLRHTPHRHADPLAAPPPPDQSVLLRGIDHIELAYWRGAWLPAWSETTLPTLIRLRIVFPRNDPRHWPDIVMAPKRGPGRN